MFVNLYLRTLIFTILVPGSLTVYIPYLLLSSGLELLPYKIGALRLSGVLPIIVGVIFYLWCVWGSPSYGKGTPAPVDEPKTLVTKGLYRKVRNPIYIGVAFILLGEAIFFESFALFAYAILLWFLFHIFVVYYEEPHLKEKFGSEYEEYCRRVPRWFPRMITQTRRASPD